MPAAAQLAPTVSRVTIVSSPVSGQSYGAGEEIRVLIDFNVPVEIDTSNGFPQLAVSIGSVTRNQDSLSWGGNGGTRLRFGYVVQAADRDDDGISVRASALALNGAVIQSRGGVDALLGLGAHAIASAAGHEVDGRRVTPAEVTSVRFANGGARTAGWSIDLLVEFSVPIRVNGSPRLALGVGTRTRQAEFVEKHDQSVLRFRYVFRGADSDTDGISIGAKALTLNGGSIQSVLGSDARLDLGRHAVRANDDHGDSDAHATAVPVPSVTPGVLSIGDRDSFAFQVKRSGEYTFETRSIDTFGYLHDIAGRAIVGESQLPLRTNLAPGTYYLGIRSASAAMGGSYALHIYSDHDTDSDGTLDHLDAFPGDPTRKNPVEGISATVDNQILVELRTEDISAPNPFDLNRRTLIFTPNAAGAYSRSVQPLEWEEDLGEEVADRAGIGLRSFEFQFAGRRWDSFFVSRDGVITFGEPLEYSYWGPTGAVNRFSTMAEIADDFVSAPTISPLYKPFAPWGERFHRLHVAHWPDRVAVTWFATDSDNWVHGVPPRIPTRFQAVLHANGTIEFNYIDVDFGDGIVGLYPYQDVVKGDLIARLLDSRDPEIRGHIDVLDVAVYATNTDAVIVEFTTREPIPRPQAETLYTYRLHLDTDRPFWTRWRDDEEDSRWQVDVNSDGGYRVVGRGVRKVLSEPGTNRIALLVDSRDLRGVSASAIAVTGQIRNDRWVDQDYFGPVTMRLPPETSTGPTDLSRSSIGFSARQSEVFHYSGLPDLDEIICRVVDALGDRFDLFAFHNEFRIDTQESRSSPWRAYESAVLGTGLPWSPPAAPCSDGRLKGRWDRSVWTDSGGLIEKNRPPGREHDVGLALFAHELAHTWLAHASYDKSGTSEPLHGEYCNCHWRYDLHSPAAFPWHDDEPGPRSLMGGQYWRDNGDGTFTPRDGYHGGGFSWLDLYLMGFAEASEVPDTFVLRNPRPVNRDDPWGSQTGTKETVSINQVIAALGLRVPGPAVSQKKFNAGFVYLVEPGQTPSGDRLGLHASYLDNVKVHWSRITGGRSSIATSVTGSATE